WEGGDISSGNAVFTNQEGATFEARGELSWFDVYTSTTFNNEGSFRKTGAGTATFDVPFDSSGSMDVDAGTVELEQGGNLQAIGRVAAGAVLGLNSGTFNLLPGLWVTGDGFAIIGNNPDGEPTAMVFGTVTMSNVELRNSASLHGPGTLNVTRTLNWQSGTMAGTGLTVIKQKAVMKCYFNSHISRECRTHRNQRTNHCA